jgi:hypothetical protein
MEGFPDILTAKMIAEHLHISQRQVYNLLALSPTAGGIPSLSFGKLKRVRRSDYEIWLSRCMGEKQMAILK